jgi:hypothetical protein
MAGNLMGRKQRRIVRPLWRSGLRGRIILKMNLKKIGCNDVDWIELAVHWSLSLILGVSVTMACT